MLIEHCSRASVQRSQSDLADPAAHSFPTLKRLEAGFGPPV
jgi:hypothetical protein